MFRTFFQRVADVTEVHFVVCTYLIFTEKIVIGVTSYSSIAIPDLISIHFSSIRPFETE